MPEGDTVYQAALMLTEALSGKSLVRGELRHPRLSTLDLKGRTVLGARSVGKHLFVRFDRDLSLHNHLLLDGSWRLYRPGARVNHQARAVLATETTTAVGINLHLMQLVPTPDEHRLVDHLGPDLLDPEWSERHAAEALARLKTKPDREIGAALLDQTIMAGVGNVYRAEICFLLGVSPWTPVSEVDAERAIELSRELLLRNATNPIRNTTGDARRRLWIYGRGRVGCLRCGGPVMAASLGEELRARVAFYCPACQPGPHP